MFIIHVFMQELMAYISHLRTVNSPRVLVLELVYQGLAGGPGEEHSDDVSICDIGQCVALLGEASNELAERLPLLLLTTPEVPGVVGTLVRALKVPP